MPFDADAFKRNRERTVTLSDGNTVIVRRPSPELAKIIINAIGHRLTPSQLMMVEKMKAAGESGENVLQNPEFWEAHAADFERWVYACICYSPTEPKFVIDEADAVNGALPVEMLGIVPDDALAVVTPIWEFLELTTADARVLAPFPESSGLELVSGCAGSGSPQPVA